MTGTPVDQAGGSEVAPWDVFVSYASEDREAVAAPLAALLEGCGVRVWFDRTELRVGDSLRERVDDGLARSRYGVVVLSPDFFRKHYPTRELNGLAQREIDGTQVILPVWHRVTDADVRRNSPPLADRIAARVDAGLPTVAAELLRVIRPDLVEQLTAEAVRDTARVVDLPRVTSGEQLMQALAGAHAHQAVHDEFASEEEAELVGGFLQEAQDWIDISDDLGPAEIARAEFALTERLGELTATGWHVYARQLARRMRSQREAAPEPSAVAQEPTTWRVAAVAVVRADRAGVAVLGNQFVIRR